MTTLTLIGKPGCHLCDDARAVVTTVLTEFPDAALDELSILDDEALRDRYAEEIPVLLIDGAVHTYWRVDAERLRAALTTPTR
ncbi:MAG: glutaredoxin family protein [Leifsonia flava]